MFEKSADLYSRAPYGARGLKRLIVFFLSVSWGRAPYGARGLKHPPKDHPRTNDMSRSVRGAWIETIAVLSSAITVLSRSVRGAWIETTIATYSTPGEMSRSVRGAWIETPKCVFSARPAASRSVRGAWIETEKVKLLKPQLERRAPYGARGLKRYHHIHKRPENNVALRTGRVD